MQNNKRFEEQEAPLKNTDHAYVKVGKDGKPEMPENKQDNSSEQPEKGEDSVTTIQHR